jgi:hypothetical protein
LDFEDSEPIAIGSFLNNMLCLIGGEFQAAINQSKTSIIGALADQPLLFSI